MALLTVCQFLFLPLSFPFADVPLGIELEKTLSSAWYEVDFESGRAEYEYRINAYTGEILSATTD